MPRLTRIYTRTGDAGDTALGAGGRLPKDDPRVEAYGTVDELSSVLGVALAAGLRPRAPARAERAVPPRRRPLRARGGQGEPPGPAHRSAPRRGSRTHHRRAQRRPAGARQLRAAGRLDRKSVV